MKVLFMSDRYPPYFEGGYELNCEANARGLESRGHDVYVLTSMYGVGGPRVDGRVYRVMHSLDDDKAKGFPRRMDHFRNAWFGRANYRAAQRVAQEVQPDIVVVWRMGHVSIFPVKAVQDLDLPVVYRLGDYWLKEYKLNCVTNPSLHRRIYRNAMFGGYCYSGLDFTNMIYVSEFLARDYEGAGFKGGNTAVIPPGIDEGLIKASPPESLKDSSRGVRLVYAGRVVEEKGVHVAVEAMSYLVNKLGRKDVHLDIVGNGPGRYISMLKEWASVFNVAGHVTIMGQLPLDQLMASYGSYHALLFTSLWDEPFGMTIIEAMSQGLPVVATDVGDVSEIITDKENGLIVPAGDPVMLANAVVMLAEDPALAYRLGAAGIRTAKDKYTNERVMYHTEKYLLSVLHDREAGHGKKRTHAA